MTQLSMKKTFIFLGFLLSIPFAVFAETDSPKTTSGYEISENHNIMVGVSYTYWSPYWEQANIGYSTGSFPYYGDYLRPALRMESGFKVHAKVGIYDGWSICANYTWFNHYPTFKPNTFVTGLDTYNSPYSIDEPSATDFASLESKNTIWFNRIDVSLDKCYFYKKRFQMKPWIGILGAWDTESLEFNGEIDGGASSDLFCFKQNWWAAGPYAGSDFALAISKAFHAFVKPGMAVLLANHDISNTITELSTSGSYSNPSLNNHYSLMNVEPMVEASIGLRFMPKLDHLSLMIEAMWETQNYFSHTGYLWNYSPTGLLGSYSMQGLTLGLTLSF